MKLRYGHSLGTQRPTLLEHFAMLSRLGFCDIEKAFLKGSALNDFYMDSSHVRQKPAL
jgi:hypothetical protein